MSYADNREQGLGIAPVVAAVVPLATKVIGAIFSLFKKKPKPPTQADLDRAKNYFDFRIEYWASAFEKGDADTALMNLDIIKRAGAVPGGKENPLWREYADAAIQVINEYLATHPTRTVTTTSGQRVQISADAPQTKTVKKADGTGFERVDVATGQVVKAGVLGGMPALVIFGGLASLAFVAWSSERKRR